VHVVEYATPTLDGPVAGLHVNVSPCAGTIVPEKFTVTEFCGAAESAAVTL
jgi:hypothetical protein